MYIHMPTTYLGGQENRRGLSASKLETTIDEMQTWNFSLYEEYALKGTTDVSVATAMLTTLRQICYWNPSDDASTWATTWQPVDQSDVGGDPGTYLMHNRAPVYKKTTSTASAAPTGSAAYYLGSAEYVQDLAGSYVKWGVWSNLTEMLAGADATFWLRKWTGYDPVLNVGEGDNRMQNTRQWAYPAEGTPNVEPAMYRLMLINPNDWDPVNPRYMGYITVGTPEAYGTVVLVADASDAATPKQVMGGIDVTGFELPTSWHDAPSTPVYSQLRVKDGLQAYTQADPHQLTEWNNPDVGAGDGKSWQGYIGGVYACAGTTCAVKAENPNKELPEGAISSNLIQYPPALDMYYPFSTVDYHFPGLTSKVDSNSADIQVLATNQAGRSCGYASSSSYPHDLPQPETLTVGGERYIGQENANAKLGGGRKACQAFVTGPRTKVVDPPKGFRHAVTLGTSGNHSTVTAVPSTIH